MFYCYYCHSPNISQASQERKICANCLKYENDNLAQEQKLAAKKQAADKLYHQNQQNSCKTS